MCPDSSSLMRNSFNAAPRIAIGGILPVQPSTHSRTHSPTHRLAHTLNHACALLSALTRSLTHDEKLAHMIYATCLHTLHQVSDAYGCQGGIMLSAQTWLGIAAALLMVLLMASKVKAAIAWGVLFATVIAWIPGHHASYFSGPPGSPGALRFEEFKQVTYVRRGWCLCPTLTNPIF